MTLDQLKAFLAKVKGDSNLQEKLKAAKSPEDVVGIAKEAGFSITAEDIQSMKSESVRDEELESAAGGLSEYCRTVAVSEFCRSIICGG